MILELLDILSILVTLLFFSIGSYYDLKLREVSDKLWLVYAPIGLGLTTGRLILEPSTLPVIAMSGVITLLIAFGLFYLGLFGGADAKAILCLGATIPITPNVYQPAMGYVHPFFPLMVVIMSYLCSVAVILWLGCSNICRYIGSGGKIFRGLEESWWRKIMACITGYPVKFAKLRSTFYLYPMEEIIETVKGPQRVFKLFVSAEEDRSEEVAKLAGQLSRINYLGEVWVTPGLPHLVFLMLAIIITLAVGDPLFVTVMKFSHLSL